MRGNDVQDYISVFNTTYLCELFIFLFFSLSTSALPYVCVCVFCLSDDPFFYPHKPFNNIQPTIIIEWMYGYDNGKLQVFDLHLLLLPIPPPLLLLLLKMYVVVIKDSPVSGVLGEDPCTRCFGECVYDCMVSMIIW